MKDRHKSAPLGEPYEAKLGGLPETKIRARLIQGGNPTIAPRESVHGKIETEVESFNRSTDHLWSYKAALDRQAESGGVEADRLLGILDELETEDSNQ